MPVIRTIDEIYGSLSQSYAQSTGLAPNAGGDMEIRLRAFAVELHSLEVQNDWLQRQCFPQSATGKHLDWHAELRALRRREPVCAVGMIRFSLAQALAYNITVPEGVVCISAGGTEFVTTQPTVIPAETLFCDAQAMARTSGTSGNVPSGSIVYMAQPPLGVVACHNPLAFTGGVDAEGDESLRVRVLRSYKKLPNGANAVYYEEEALSVPGVSSVVVLPRARGRGTVDIVITAPGGMPDPALISAVQQKLEQQREICVDIEVSAPQAVNIHVSVFISPSPGYSFTEAQTQAGEALNAYFSGKLLGKKLLRVQLQNVLLGLESVENFIIATPGGDVTVTGRELPVLSYLEIADMGG